MTRALLEAIREQPGERTPEQLASDLGLKIEKVRRQIERLRAAGKLGPSVYRLTPLFDGGEQRVLSVVRFGALEFSIGYRVGHRAIPDTRSPMAILKNVPKESGLRASRPDDLEIQIIRELQRGDARPGELAARIGVPANSGTFARACAYLVEEAIVLDWRAPYPANQ